MRSAPRLAPTATAPALVLVADRGHARFFTARSPRAPLVEVAELTNPDARRHEGQLVSDRSGRLTRGMQRGGHAVRTAESAREHVGATFARQVCARLQALRKAGPPGHIHVVAESGFLGLLRQHLDRPTRALVASETAKSLADRTRAEIRRHLPARL